MLLVLLAFALVQPYPPSTPHARSHNHAMSFAYYPQRSATFLFDKGKTESTRVRIEARTDRVDDDDYSRDTAVLRNGRSLYVCAGSHAYVEQYRLGKRGAIISHENVEAHSHPTSINVHPNGRFAYVCCSHGAICQYRVSAAGKLVPFSINEVYAKNDPSPVRFDRSGRFACIVTQDGDGMGTAFVYRIRKNGTLVEITNLRCPQIAVHVRRIRVSNGKVRAE